MLRKSIAVEVKATNDGAGFTGYASTWTREPDAYGDIVAKGAFTRTLKEWKEKGLPIPVLWRHRLDQPEMFIGVVIEAIEDDHGLKVTCSLDLDNPTGAQVHRLLKAGAVAQMSFAYDVVEDAVVTLDDKTKARELRDLTLYEVSVVPIGANQDTSIEDVKHAPTALTDDEINTLRAIAAERMATTKTAPEEGEGDDNTHGSEAAPDGGKAARVEAVARLNQQINALTGQKGA
ncbi:HK97 family phage prohead protease [Actinomyces timonensis]|uniref:HK97 family phage prohead protease n=1 Tax=Actinomyces timonensis TaxID=1288391 RepID=UPI0002E1F334|nr:HK97 family phage prohead protease [Actinomyces timonensis]